MAESDLDDAWSGRTSATDLIWRHLDAAAKRWLLIVDNVDEPSWLAGDNGRPGDGTGWLRSSPAGLTVVTSRAGSPDIWGSDVVRHRVDVLKPEDARDVLLDLAGGAGELEDAQSLAVRLDGLPLALRLAGSYLSRAARSAGLLLGPRAGGPIRTFRAYSEALTAAGADFLDTAESNQRRELDTEQLHSRLVSRTWELTLDLMEQQGAPEARSVMRLLSCFAPTPFPVQLVVGGGLDGRLGADPDRALAALVDFSLVDVVEADSIDDESAPCVVLHRLVLESSALRLGSGPAAEAVEVWRTAAASLERGLAHAPEPKKNWPWWRVLAPHVSAVLERAPVDEETLTPLLRAGIATFAYYTFSGHGGSRELASLMARRATLPPEDHPLRLSIRHRAAFALLEGEAELAEYEAVAAVQEARLGADHPETLISLYNRAHSRYEHDLLTSAELEAQIRAILEARRRVLGPEDPYTIMTLSDLAWLVKHNEHGSRAEYHELISRFATVAPDDHRFLPLYARHQMAHFLDDSQRWPEAEAEYRSILADLEENDGDGTSLRFELSFCLATNLSHQRRHDEAVEMLDAVAAWFDDSDPEHDRRSDEALEIRHRCAERYKVMGREVEAERQMREVLAERLRVVDAEDSVVLLERHCLAHVIEAQSRYADAEAELATVAESFAKLLGPDNYETRRARFCQARNLRRLGRLPAALRLYRLVLSAETKELGATHPSTLETEFEYCQVRWDLGLLAPAEARAAFELTLARCVACSAPETLISALRGALEALPGPE
ncbi:MAG TPA: tetratricopeptide repeat protein [Actinocrinis sp.]